MKTKSIYKDFSTRLIIATTLFVVVISFIFYGFTKTTIYEEVMDDLLEKARLIKELSNGPYISRDRLNIIVDDKIVTDIIVVEGLDKIVFKDYYEDKSHYIVLLYPLDLSKNTFLKIVKNIDSSDEVLRKIFSNLFILGIGGLIMIIIYALAVSKTLLSPIVSIAQKLSNMNENSLAPLQIEKFPVEFHSLANSINNLTKKIQMYVKYQKELFIGAAHELKTPLSVIKLKCEVTLIKERNPKEYQETLMLIINESNHMNKMVSSILEFGRQEGAQFERPIEVNVVEFLKKKIENYKLLGKEKKISILLECSIEKFKTIIQPTLLTQIIQNFVQNSIKFSPPEKEILIKIYADSKKVIIEVIDEGTGIDENIDIFAPFKRVGEKPGAGLGLFLAKSAADAIGAEITLENRTNNEGTIARLTLTTNPTCTLKVL